METSTLLHVRAPDLEYIGQMCLRLLGRLVDRARAARLTIAPERIIDIPYDWLTTDPHETVPRLYNLIGARWTSRDADTLHSMLARPARARRHEYELSRYGLDPITVEATFGDYGRWATLPGPEPSHR